jgi:hypothetical protein
MMPMSAEAGLPLVDVHHLTFDEAASAATEAIVARVADRRRRADPAARTARRQSANTARLC